MELSVLYFFVLVVCLGVVDPAYAEESQYKIRLVDFASGQPVPDTAVAFVPRDVYLKTLSSNFEPTKKYSFKRVTNAEGIWTLTEEELRNKIMKSSQIVDCLPQGFSRFTIEYNPISNRYQITAFDNENRVRPLEKEFLIKGEVFDVSLDRIADRQSGS